MAHLEDRHADARHADQVALRLLEDGQREHGRAGREVEDAWCCHDDCLLDP
jgi:hypothetical protein